MKKLLLLAFIAFAPIAKSQSAFQVTELGTTTPAQWNYVYNTDVNNTNSPTELLEFKIQNVSGSSKITKIRKSILTMATNTVTATNHDIYFCYNQTCFGPATNYWYATIAAGASLPNGNGSYGLRTEFDHNMIVGTSVVRYTVYDSTNISDSLHITITYNVSAANAVKEHSANMQFLNAAPNPAANFVNFNYDLNSIGSASVKIYNSLGNLVKNISLAPNSRSTQVDVSSLEEGFYFYSVIADGKVVSTRRLVITR